MMMLAVGSEAAPNKADYMTLAKRGWSYEYRGSIRRQVPDIPASHVLARTMAKRDICLLGSVPHPLTNEILAGFRGLLGQIFGDVGSVFDAVDTLTDCPTSATVFVRIYDRSLPFLEYNRDLQDLNSRFEIGMSDQTQQILSPAQAVTFFGKKGQATHITLMQPKRHRTTPLERRFFRSIMIEELYQSYSFGIDVFKVGRGGPYDSKLQESFVNLQGLSWLSESYMEGLLSSNPLGLCDFDLLMLHALAEVDENLTESNDFVQYLDNNFERLVTTAQEFAHRSHAAALMDPGCTGHTIRLTAQ